jgi:uncharacterized SAM-binding protein YcdF (DUF218 family)
MNTEHSIDLFAKKLWDYHLMHHQIKKSDCIFVLGNHDTRTALRAIELHKQRLAPFIVFSGGLGNFTEGKWQKSEADTFAEIALAHGVPAKDILIENKSTNTGENILFTQKLLSEKRLDPQTFILVQKPTMERRSYATFKQHWPDKDAVVTSPQISYEEYPSDEIPKDELINIMVGDLQRIKEYPAKGFQIAQEIPDDVWQAYNKLIDFGYTSHLMKG